MSERCDNCEHLQTALSCIDLVSRIRFALGDDGARMQDELVDYCRELRAKVDERDRYREALIHFVGIVLSVRKHNTEEWMDGIAEDVNGVAKTLGDEDRFAFDGDGLRKIRRAAIRPEGGE